MELTDILGIFLSNLEEYTIFSSAHGTFSRIDQIFGHKLNLSKFKKTEIILSIFQPPGYETRYQLQGKKKFEKIQTHGD